MKNVFYNIAIGDNFIFAFFVRRFTAGRIEFYFAFMKIIINVNEISTKINPGGFRLKDDTLRELFINVNCRAYFRLAGKSFGNSLAAQAITLSSLAPQSRTKVMVANSSITSVGYAGPASR